MQTHCELLALIDRDRNFFFHFLKIYIFTRMMRFLRIAVAPLREDSHALACYVMPVTLETI